MYQVILQANPLPYQHHNYRFVVLMLKIRWSIRMGFLFAVLLQTSFLCQRIAAILRP